MTATLSRLPRSLLREPRRAFAEFVNLLRRVCFRERLIELFARFSAQGSQVGPLRVRHRLVACLPLVGLAQQSRLIRIVGRWVPHEANRQQNTSHFLSKTACCRAAEYETSPRAIDSGR
jgi:hypothetical protein